MPSSVFTGCIGIAGPCRLPCRCAVRTTTIASSYRIHQGLDTMLNDSNRTPVINSGLLKSLSRRLTLASMLPLLQLHMSQHANASEDAPSAASKSRHASDSTQQQGDTDYTSKVSKSTQNSNSSSGIDSRSEDSGFADSTQCSNGLVGGLPLNSYTTPDGSASLLWPCGWSQVKNLDPAYGILASFYNPKQPGVETVAVYISPTDISDTTGLGTTEAVGQGLAHVAPFGELQEHFSFSSAGTTYYVVRVMFGGNTAGMFGAVIEYRCIAISKGMKYTLRATTSRYRWLAYPEVSSSLVAMARSFRVLK